MIFLIHRFNPCYRGILIWGIFALQQFAFLPLVSILVIVEY